MQRGGGRQNTTALVVQIQDTIQYRVCSGRRTEGRVPMRNGMIRGVVFDMDGVLIDSHPVHRSAWRKFLTSIGRRTTDTELEFILDGRKREEILRYFLGDLPPEQIEEYGIRKDKMLREI